MGLICILLQVWIIALVIRIVLTWFPTDPDSPVATIRGYLALITDPVLTPVRKVLPDVNLGSARLDLSPLLVIIGAQIILGFLC